jgi:glycosyltransferase involved in cell wall biosynthesis/peptidoglycan/xylan/chitin deacetylase (PgdA/CDA1 family)/ribosomal protein S18 acetylase RimI-like enzyme
VDPIVRVGMKVLTLPFGAPFSRRAGDAVVLCYHRVGAGDREIDVPRRAFREHLEYLAAEGLAGSLERALAGDGGAVVTVDDGFRDFYDVVLPELLRTGVPALLYLATGFVGTGDPRSGVGPDGALTWPMLQEAVSTGLVTIGSHTHSHVDLSRADEREATDEMRRSVELIEDRLGLPCRHFAYPWGKASPAAERAARATFDTAALDAWRTNRAQRTDPHRLGRVPVLRSDAPLFFRAKVAGRLNGERLAYRALRRGPWAPPSTEPNSTGAETTRTAPVGRSVRVAHITTVDLTLRFMLLEQLKLLVAEGFDVAGISAPGRWLDELADQGVEPVAWRSATRQWSPLADVRAFRELVAILRAGRYDIVHTHNPKPGLIGRVAARLAGVPVVVNTVHGFYTTRQDPPRRRVPVMTLEWIAARFSDAELYQSGEDMAWARHLRLVPARRQHFLGNGTDLERFDPGVVDPSRLISLREEFGIPSDALVVGMIGRLVREKGYGEYFRAARAVRARHPNVVFLAIGPLDPDKGDAISSEEQEAHSSDVVFTGFRRDARDLLALMDVFVLPSWREGMPRSAVEAAAMGRALVLTDIRGCREVARDGVEAIFVPPRDADRLAEAILRLVDDPGLRTRLGSAARDRALQRFDEKAVAARVVSVYRTLLPPPRRPARRLDLEGLQDVIIRPATRADVQAMAAMHASVMDPEAFLPMLGEPFLRRLFLALVSDPDAPTFVADRRGEVIGYTSGVVSMSAFRRRFILRHGIGAAFAAAPRLVRPGLLPRTFELFSYPEKTVALPEAEHTLIGVKPRTAPGLGMALTEQALAALADRGVREVKCYVNAANLTMQRVVRRVGFEPVGEIVVHDGQPSLVYTYRCPSS